MVSKTKITTIRASVGYVQVNAIAEPVNDAWTCVAFGHLL
jgi:hypothetical protein